MKAWILVLLGLASGCDQNAKGQYMATICAAPQKADLQHNIDCQARDQVLSKWLVDQTSGPKALTFLTAFGNIPMDLRAEFLRAEAKKQGLDRCPLADLIEQPALPQGLQLPVLEGFKEQTWSGFCAYFTKDKILFGHRSIDRVDQEPLALDANTPVMLFVDQEAPFERLWPMVDKLAKMDVPRARLMSQTKDQHLSGLDFRPFAGPAKAQQKGSLPPLKLTVFIRPNGFVIANVSDAMPDFDQTEPSVPLNKDGYDLAKLQERLIMVKENYPGLTPLYLVPDHKTPVALLAKVIHSLRQKDGQILFPNPTLTSKKNILIKGAIRSAD